MADVFLSFSTSDNLEAESIVGKLKSKSISFFFAPEHLEFGGQVADEIRNELKAWKVVFVLLSEAALKSEWVTLEWSAAWALRRKIVPVLLAISADALPLPLLGLKAVNFDQIDKAIDEFVGPGFDKTKALIFDIDGTLLHEDESFQDEDKAEALELLRRLTQNGFRLVFITGNDYRKQYPRILKPLIQNGLGAAAFCFTDGGSRAFEFHADIRDFVEIQEYSKTNVIDHPDERGILREFDDAFQHFSAEHQTLRIPHILPYRRTLNHLDYIIRPIRPSFWRGPVFAKFCKDLQECCERATVHGTTYDLVKNVMYALIIRAHGKSPGVDDDLARLMNIVLGELLLKTEYLDISRPEAEVRGGEVVCQIALKPFKDDLLRIQFRDIIDQRLNQGSQPKFAVLVAGRSTIDIQRYDVNKAKAVQFVTQRMNFDPTKSFYFGDEFVSLGNDLPVARMGIEERPGTIVHVGNIERTTADVKECLILDGNGPKGTLNYLRVIDALAAQPTLKATSA